MICTKFILLHRRKAPPSISLKYIEDTKVSSMVAPGECYEPETKRKCTEPKRERMSGDLMELNNPDLHYINFGDEADSD